MNFLEGKPLHARKRIAVIATGSVGIALVLLMVYLYSRPQHFEHDPEIWIVRGYTTIISPLQSLFHRK